MSGLELNKVAAAVLFAGLLAMIAGNVADVLYAPNLHESQKNAKRGYEIEVAESTNGAEVKAEKEEPVDLSALMKTADATSGAKIFKKCSMCHSYDKGGKNKVGPNLWDIVANSKASKPGYKYSSAAIEMSGIWGYEELYAFLKNPKKYMKGTKMSFAGLKKDSDIADVIAFLRQQSDSPKPLP